MASARSRSPFELPLRKSGHERLHSRLALPPQPSLQITRMPISFGVLILWLGVTWFVCLSLSAALYRGAAARAEQMRRTTEQRLDREVAQLRAAVVSQQTQLDLRAHDIAEQTRETERMSAALESARGLRGIDARSARVRREKR